MKCDAANQISARRGSELSWAKLTEADVRMIRRIHQEARAEIRKVLSWGSEKALAEKFNVTEQTIHKALRYVTWRHVRD